MLCCGIKPFCGWLCERTASVSRERCGGQGYLSCNRFGTLIGFAHATVTAEGDNRVLMQKVAKELLGVAGAAAVQSRLAAAERVPPPVRSPVPLCQRRRCAAGWGCKGQGGTRLHCTTENFDQKQATAGP